MEEVPHSNKKVLLLAGGAIGVTLIFLFLAYWTIRPNNTASPSAAESENEAKTTDLSSEQPANPTSVSGWKVYKNDRFTLEYPPDWSSREVKLANGGAQVKLTPLTKSKLTPVMAIIADSISAAPSIRQKQQLFLNLGFATESYSVDELTATKIKGTLPPSNKPASASAKKTATLQLTHIFLDKGNFSYLFDYSYVSDQRNEELESVFTKMISSFKFTQ